MSWTRVFHDRFSTDVPIGGFAAPVGNGTNAMYDRHFTALPPAVDAMWWSYPDGMKDSTGHGIYTPSKTVSIANGVMSINLCTPPSGKHLCAAMVPKVPGCGPMGGLQEGKYVIEFRCHGAMPHWKVAWLLWPDSKDWPHDGEIDFPEVKNLGSTINGFVHHQDATDGSDQQAFHTDTIFSDGHWHEAIIERRNGSVSFFLDGALVGTATDRVPTTPMHWVIQCETSLEHDQPTPSEDVLIEIDRVAVYVPK